jgi:hypothetical protein
MGRDHPQGGNPADVTAALRERGSFDSQPPARARYFRNTGSTRTALSMKTEVAMDRAGRQARARPLRLSVVIRPRRSRLEAL